MVSIEWTRPARDDLARLDEQLSDLDPDLADRVGRAVIASGAFLTEHPRAGPDFGRHFLRKWRVRGTRYILIYRIRGDTVQILRLVHDRSDWLNL